jgi:acetamidase/formamidase
MVEKTTELPWLIAECADPLTAIDIPNLSNVKLQVRSGQPGIQSTFPPTRCGGNLDCRELTEGTALFLPIAVDGALFSTGDGHALQGDGEVAGPALNCPMEVEMLNEDNSHPAPCEDRSSSKPADAATDH